MTSAHENNGDWRQLLSDAISNPQELLTLLELDPGLLTESLQVAKRFPLRVPLGFVARMKKKDPNDPLLRQILPLGLELQDNEGYRDDPLEEMTKNPLPGLLHKFHGRVLLILTAGCAVHCRYCFRQHFPYSDNNPGSQGWQDVIQYIEKDPSISEVILSGGDPLIATDKTLQALSSKLEQIPHLKRLRIHSRIPIVLPERITNGFIDWVKSLCFNTCMVVHCNHPQELNTDVRKAVAALSQAGMSVLNQSVLLKGVNDSVEVLTELSETLFEYGILPYYLFALDKVRGAAHFDIPLERARSLHQSMSERLPGYLLPRLTKEEPGAPSKVSLCYCEKCS